MPIPGFAGKFPRPRIVKIPRELDTDVLIKLSASVCQNNDEAVGAR